MGVLNADQQAANERPHIKYAYFIELFFQSGTSRISTLNVPCEWGGYEWMGFGAVGDISPIERNQGTAASSMTFTLNLASVDWLALATGPVEQYRGRDAKMYFCPLTDTLQLVGTPKPCWRGTMDTMPSGVSGSRDNPVGSISLVCETSAYGLKRPTGMRLNAAQQKLKYPNDTAFDHLVNLIGKPIPWLSIRFQRR